MIEANRVTGRRFEDLLFARGKSDEKLGMYCIDRMGVQVKIDFTRGRERPEYTPIQSFPDFFGSFDNGVGYVFDAKVCSQASWSLAKSSFKPRQYRFMIKRSKFGEYCGIVLHFNPRKTKRTERHPSTWWVPVFEESPIWQGFEEGYRNNINPNDCEEYAIPILWNRRSKDARMDTPDIGSVLHKFRTRSHRIVHLHSHTIR